MNLILKLEELGMLLLAVALFAVTDFAWWWLPALILVPDISMVGYLIGEGAGAVLYNIFHHKGAAAICFIIGSVLAMPVLELAGIILFAHSSLDRMLGYGLKYRDSFRHTHLGWIGGGERPAGGRAA